MSLVKLLLGKVIEEVVETAAEEAFKRLHQYMSDNGMSPEKERGVSGVAELGGKHD